MNKNLENLAKTGGLKAEAYSEMEFSGLIISAKRRLVDSKNPSLAPESRFDLAYNASHAYALAALRAHGYRSENRFLVFQVLEHTVGMAAPKWRVLSKCHNVRNLSEYEGHTDIDPKLLAELIDVATELEAMVAKLPQSTKR